MDANVCPRAVGEIALSCSRSDSASNVPASVGQQRMAVRAGMCGEESIDPFESVAERPWSVWEHAAGDEEIAQVFSGAVSWGGVDTLVADGRLTVGHARQDLSRFPANQPSLY